MDVSIVLNVHNEARYFRRTLRSLEEATRYAGRYDISVEIVVVVDQPDASSTNWIASYDFSTFSACQVIEVNNGDLGLSRNDGIGQARGDVLILADADDLISFNLVSETTFAVRSADTKTVFVPQYHLGFGSKNYYFWEYFGSDHVTALNLFDVHPYVSRISGHRAFLSTLLYCKSSPAVGYAYEDWHMACEIIAAGGRYALVNNVMLFYRQRPDSLLQTNRTGRITPHSKFFTPRSYLSACTKYYFAPNQQPPQWQSIKASALASQTIPTLIKAANAIDPFISYTRFLNGGFGSNVPSSDKAGRSYFRMCKLIGSAQFTDVVLMPFLATGGADKYVLQILEGLAALDPRRRALVLFGQKIYKHEWLDRLPARSLAVDLYRACADPTEELLHTLTLRIIESCAPEAEIHVKACEYANGFVRLHHRKLARHKINFYYFVDTIFVHHGRGYSDGDNFNFISDIGESLARVISDHRANLEYLDERIDLPTAKRETLYANCPVSTKQKSGRDATKKKLLWASRLDRQKRPDLLVAIAGRLKREMPEHHIDVFGSAVLDAFDTSAFADCPNVAYRGGFTSFDALLVGDYDALLYTAMFDGLPNVVLEAMAAGLPVVAPDVGGIGEVVTGDTGFLVENSPSDAVLIERYVGAIRALYQDEGETRRRCTNAMELIRKRHSREAYLERLADIFNVGRTGISVAAE